MPLLEAFPEFSRSSGQYPEVSSITYGGAWDLQECNWKCSKRGQFNAGARSRIRDIQDLWIYPCISMAFYFVWVYFRQNYYSIGLLRFCCIDYYTYNANHFAQESPLRCYATSSWSLLWLSPCFLVSSVFCSKVKYLPMFNIFISFYFSL